MSHPDKRYRSEEISPGMGQAQVRSKGSAYADDINITIPRKESTLRSLIKAIDDFTPISGLKVNHDKT